MPDAAPEDHRTARIRRGWTDRGAEVLARVAWLLGEGIGATRCGRLVEAFGGAAPALAATPAAVAEVLRASLPAARTWLDAARAARDGDAAREVERAHERGIRLAMPGDRDFPTLLEVIPDPPPLLWVRGVLDPRTGGAASGGESIVESVPEGKVVSARAASRSSARDEPRVAVVGSRRATAYGLEQSARFAGGLAESGIAVVSGGARGIDAAAHRAALRAGGRTIAVLGSGLLEPYPPEHAGLFDSIAEAGGAVISEFPLAQPPRPGLFPRRNRIISGLALGVVVVEAARRSGSLITARLAVEEHGREAMVVPGRVDAPRSAGCLRAVREGWASMVTSAAEVIESLGGAAAVLLEGAAERRGASESGTCPPSGSPECRSVSACCPSSSSSWSSSSSSSASSSAPHSPGDGSRAGAIVVDPNSPRGRIMSALRGRDPDDPSVLDELVAKTGLEASRVLVELTLARLGR